MNTLTLRRMTQIDEQTDLAELGRRAAAELKYTYLMSWTHRPLLHVLISLRIFPFLEADVTAYQEAVGGSFVRPSYTAFGINRYVHRRWVSRSIRSYERPVPANIIADMLAIKERMPEVAFHVHELVAETVFDPFLEASHEAESYFIHVWNEPVFTDAPMTEQVELPAP